MGFELTGQNALTLTPAAKRQARLERVWGIGDGAVMAAQRKFCETSGKDVSIEEIYMPFGNMPNADTRLYLVHSNWRHDGNEWVQGTVTTNLELARNETSMPLAVSPES